MNHAYNPSRSSTTLFVGQDTEEEEEEDDKKKKMLILMSPPKLLLHSSSSPSERTFLLKFGFWLFRNDPQARDSRERNSAALNLLNINPSHCNLFNILYRHKK
jgi:hypothetical protein